MKIFLLSFIWMCTLCDDKLHTTSFHTPSHSSPSNTESSLTIQLTEIYINMLTIGQELGLWDYAEQ